MKSLFLVLINFFFLNLFACFCFADSNRDSSRVSGIGLQQALVVLEQYVYESPRHLPLVAFIDTGVDTTSAAVAGALWTNPGEQPDGRDNDGNGFADDLHGWNFLGAHDGSWNMVRSGTEEFREFKRLYPLFKDGADSTSALSAYYRLMRKKAGIDSYLKYSEYLKRKHRACMWVDSVQLAAYGPEGRDTLTLAWLADGGEERAGRCFALLAADMVRLGADGRWADLVAGIERDYGLARRRIASIEGEADKRTLLGDDPGNPDDRRYGNPCLMVEGFEHGTFGAVLAVGSSRGRLPGICADARLMVLRAVPDGDEYDKDVALAIRYAVEKGADIINMSLGKYVSPHHEWVDSALAYAEANDVLVVHAAGNEGLNLDSVALYPSGRGDGPDGAMRPNFLRVGALDASGRRAGFSNYGRSVELYAPGEGVVSLMRGDEWGEADGTSVAAPIVTGVAALLKSRFPELTAAGLKRILVEGAVCGEQTGHVPALNVRLAVEKLLEMKKR